MKHNRFFIYGGTIAGVALVLCPIWNPNAIDQRLIACKEFFYGVTAIGASGVIFGSCLIACLFLIAIPILVLVSIWRGVAADRATAQYWREKFRDTPAF